MAKQNIPTRGGVLLNLDDFPAIRAAEDTVASQRMSMTWGDCFSCRVAAELDKTNARPSKWYCPTVLKSMQVIGGCIAGVENFN